MKKIAFAGFVAAAVGIVAAGNVAGAAGGGAGAGLRSQPTAQMPMSNVRLHARMGGIYHVARAGVATIRVPRRWESSVRAVVYETPSHAWHGLGFKRFRVV
jgi:hypothetical protein